MYCSKGGIVYECSCALFVHKLSTEHLCMDISVDRLLSVCAQTVDEYVCRPFAVCLCTNGLPIYRNEKEKKIQ